MRLAIVVRYYVCMISILFTIVSSSQTYITNGTCSDISYKCPAGYACSTTDYQCVQFCSTPGSSSGCLNGSYCSGVNPYFAYPSDSPYGCVNGTFATPSSSIQVSTSTCASGYRYNHNCYCTSNSQCSSNTCTTYNGISPGNICMCNFNYDCPLTRDHCGNSNTYFNNQFSFCASCTYPFSDPRNSEAEFICRGIWFNVPWYINLSFGLLFAVGYLLTIYFTESSKEMSLSLFFLLSIPSLDVITDVLYISTTPFYSIFLFTLSLFFLLLPTYLFARHLYIRGIRPKWYILEPRAYALSDLKFIFQMDISSLYTIIFYSLRASTLFLWAVIKLFPWLMLHSPIFVPVYLYGSFLYVTKLLSLKRVNNWWCRMWSGCDDFAIAEAVDWHMFNESFYLTTLLESVPQFFIQITNAVLLGSFDTVTILSISASSIMITNTMYKMILNLLYLRKPLRDIAVNVPFIGNLNNKTLHLDDNENKDVELVDDVTVDNAIFKNSIVAADGSSGTGNNLEEEVNKLFTSSSSIKEGLELLIHREVDRRLAATLANIDQRFLATQDELALVQVKVAVIDERISLIEKGN